MTRTRPRKALGPGQGVQYESRGRSLDLRSPRRVHGLDNDNDGADQHHPDATTDLLGIQWCPRDPRSEVFTHSRRW